MIREATIRKFTNRFFLFGLLTFFNNGCSMNQKQAVLFLGDSLTYGYQVKRNETYPALIQNRINQNHLNWYVINGGVNGDTIDMASRRLPYYFNQYKSIHLLVIFLGANDLLMGEDIDLVEQDLENLIKKARSLKPDIEIRLVAFGQLKGFDMSFLKPGYSKQFEEIYARIATKLDVKLISFPMVNVVGRPDLNLEDGLHPNSEGLKVIAESLWLDLKPDFEMNANIEKLK